MAATSGILDELERDLGVTARLRVLANAGGQRRYIPMPDSVEASKLSDELGKDICCWLAGRLGGEFIEFPSGRGNQIEDEAAELRAAVLEAGLTEPTRSANDIAAEFGVTLRWVRALRAQLRAERPDESLPLFPDL
tara:strand:+ start:990 stop:1397 length:408 start_codon:yes stop_codon:yes gene_type:complete